MTYPQYSEQVKQDARRAAEIIRAKGWCQGKMYDDDGRCCALGAIRAAAPFGDRFKELIDAFTNYGTDGVIKFNDADGRTKEEVLEVFDRIANS